MYDDIKENNTTKVVLNHQCIKSVRNVQMITYLDSLITSYGRYVNERKKIITFAKNAVFKNRQLQVKKDKILKCYVWSVLLYGCGLSVKT